MGDIRWDETSKSLCHIHCSHIELIRTCNSYLNIEITFNNSMTHLCNLWNIDWVDEIQSSLWKDLIYWGKQSLLFSAKKFFNHFNWKCISNLSETWIISDIPKDFHWILQTILSLESFLYFYSLIRLVLHSSSLVFRTVTYN